MAKTIKTIPESNPFGMHVTSRRDQLTGEAARWYDRAAWLAGKTLQIPAEERTAYQHDLDELWNAVELFERGGKEAVDTSRIERIFTSAFERWGSYLGTTEAPQELR